MAYQNLAEMFFNRREELPDKPAFRHKKDGQWISVSYKQAVDRAERIAAALLKAGLQAGDKAALLSNNCLEWALIDYAVISVGAVLVPVYPSLTSEQVAFLIKHSEAKILFAENERQAEKVDAIKTGLTGCGHFITMNESKPRKGWTSLSDFEQSGLSDLKENASLILKKIKTVKRQDPATIIYTSGTTGEPKGAVLLHHNFLSNIENAAEIFTFYDTDLLLSFLPLSHVLERMAGHYQAVYHTIEIAYAESIEAVPQNILEVKPTLMVSVPRLYEKMYAKILDTADSGSALKQKIFYWAVETGRTFIDKKLAGKTVGALLAFKQKIAARLVFSKLKAKMGGRIRFFVSGGAPLSPEIAAFFAAAGLYILEGYGLTETSPAITMSTLEHFRFGSAGRCLPNQEVKIAEDGEIVTRGGHVMQGYYKNPDATREVLDDDGWFYTGDIGYLDDDGFLHITDRKKNIIVTSGGKNVAPQPIENELILSKYIEQSVMIGDKRKYCTALVVLAQEAVANWAQQQGQGLIKPIDFDKHENLRKLIRQEIDRLTISYASYERIKDFYIAPAPFTIESGELTPSLKVKRNVVEKKYKDQIDALYPETDR